MEARKTKETIPFRPTLFWDVDPATIDPDKNAKYIIERIMDFGYGFWQRSESPLDIYAISSGASS